jgi:hypothetical protein
LVRDRQQKRVGFRNRFVLFELLDQRILLRRIGPAKDRPSGTIDVAELIRALLPTTEIDTIAAVYKGKDAAAGVDSPHGESVIWTIVEDALVTIGVFECKEIDLPGRGETRSLTPSKFCCMFGSSRELMSRPDPRLSS